jgi:hypothetical protein
MLHQGLGQERLLLWRDSDGGRRSRRGERVESVVLLLRVVPLVGRCSRDRDARDRELDFVLAVDHALARLLSGNVLVARSELNEACVARKRIGIFHHNILDDW